MNWFEKIIISMLLLTFPLFCYLFHIVTNKNIDEKHRDLCLEFALISIYYLNVKYQLNDLYTVLLSTIPIAFAYRKKFYLVTFILIFVSFILYYSNDYFLLLIMNIIMIISFSINRNFRRYLIGFTLLSITCLIILNQSNIIYLVAYLLLADFANYTLTKGEDLINYHIEYKDLKKEHEIRNSLFKITHEIKNPLAVCKAYIDMFDYNDIKCAQKYIPIISGEIDNLLVLLQDFLLVNKDNINFDIMDINILLEDIVRSMGELNRIDITLETVDEEIYINGDYNRLTQVLTNLVKNSYEANADDIIIRLSLTSDNVLIEIVDNGDGISELDKDKIYTPFYTTKKNGTGLGVSLSKEIIEAHNGTLEYYSNNQGTTAKILLPQLVI